MGGWGSKSLEYSHGRVGGRFRFPPKKEAGEWLLAGLATASAYVYIFACERKREIQIDFFSFFSFFLARGSCFQVKLYVTSEQGSDPPHCRCMMALGLKLPLFPMTQSELFILF